MKNGEYTIVQSIPNDSPTLIKPSFHPLILTKITHDLVKFKAKFDGRTIGGQRSLKIILESGTDLPIPWCLDGLLNVNLRPPLPTSDPSADKNADMEMKATEAIEKMLEKETSNTEIKITEKGRKKSEPSGEKYQQRQQLGLQGKGNENKQKKWLTCMQ
ncbi:Hypothetical predicted protein [Paramuricea clavata]|uniref:Uncharacterized protein n=1 Tax=Paramuricea clavata TaxID=317549 RepID=A0A6S7GAJ0_PARCT|nr:Hypothetical predicted protein [Paramuricea clavata]